jgi:hypothetical protein
MKTPWFNGYLPAFPKACKGKILTPACRFQIVKKSTWPYSCRSISGIRLYNSSFPAMFCRKEPDNLNQISLKHNKADLMKWIFILFVCVATSCTNSTVDNSKLKSTDSSSRISIDSSAIMNENSKLPSDSMKTTVNH